MNAILHMLLEITAYSAILCGVILLFQKVFYKHISAAFHYALWALLILRLMIPVTFDSGLRLFVLPDEQTASPAAVTEDARPQEPQTALPPRQTAMAAPREPVQNVTAPVKASVPAPAPEAPPPIGYPEVLVMAYFAGVLGSAAYVAVSARRLSKKLTRCQSEAPKSVLRLVEQCKKELGIRANLKVSVESFLKSPALTSSFKPKLLIPAHMLFSNDTRNLEYCIRHELTHYLRRDYLANLLLLALRCVYWFNPVVHLAFRRMQADMEAACDAGVVSRLADPDPYVRTMIDLGGSGNMPYMLGVGMSRGKKAMEKRVRRIFMKNSTGRTAKLCAVVAACLMLVACFTTACQPVAATPVSAVKAAVNPETPVVSAAAQDTFKDAPANLSMSFDQGSVSVRVNAAVSVPKGASVFTAEATPRKFTQKEIDTTVKTLTQGKPLYQPRHLTDADYTKDELTTMIADLKAGKHSDLYKMNPKAYFKEYQPEIEKYEKLLKTAPDKVVYKPADTSLKPSERSPGRFYVSVISDIEKPEPAYFNYDEKFAQTVRFLMFNYSSSDGYGADGLVTNNLNITGTTISAAKARQIAEDTVGKLGLGNFTVNGMGTTPYRSYSVKEENSKSYEQLPKCYIFYFTRNVNGINQTYAANTTVAEINANARLSETLAVAVGDAGVLSVNYMGPAIDLRQTAANVKIKPFNEIKAIFQKEIAQGEYSKDKDIQKTTLNINEIGFGYTVIERANGTYQAVPTWDFFGTITSQFKKGKGDVAQQDKNHCFTEREFRTSILTINALDGTVIHRGGNYFI